MYGETNPWSGDMTFADGLSASMEDYIEVIYQILADKEAVRAKEIAERMGVTRPSVTGALQLLARDGYVNHEPYDVITLTDKGRKIARDIVRRHRSLHDFFVSVLDVEEAEAEETACAIEHVVSRNIVDKLVAFIAKRRGKG